MADEPFHTDRLVIIGPGMLGTSIALGLKRRGFAGRITALGRSRATLDQAGQTGAYDALTDDPAEALADATLAVVAVPLSGFRAVFAQVAEHGPPGLIVTDAGSTKASVIADARACLADLSRVIGAHPMAGSEQAGPLAADADLFVDKPCVLTLAEDDDADAVAQVRALWRTLGMSILTMTPEEHDRQVAVVSHLPHLAAVLLVQTADQLGGLDLASTGYRDTTRLASSNPPMRADILLANRDAVAEALDRFIARCADLRDQLNHADRDTLLGLLQDAAEARDAWLSARPGLDAGG
ncbi:MAG: prephenate dehydrogenase [Phycisphaeraceae bacterium]